MSQTVVSQGDAWNQALDKQLARASARLHQPLSSLQRVRDFPLNYKQRFSPQRAVRDIVHIASLLQERGARFEICRPAPDEAPATRHLVFYSFRDHDLDELVPLLHNLCLRVIDQTQFNVAAGDRRIHIRDFLVAANDRDAKSLHQSRPALADALNALVVGKVEDDALNGLVLRCALDWRQVDLLRAYCNYYFQIANRFEPRRIHRALLTHPDVATLLYRYFDARFQPDPALGDPRQREWGVLSQLRGALILSLDKVQDPADDRILRDLFNIIDATLRTNFYRAATPNPMCVALKIGGLGVLNPAASSPWVEIYVHAATMEGVHMRGARVARGGVRWSERLDDFRSETLDLLRTQMVKNALIAPQGAKGCFIVKPTSLDPTTRSADVQNAYRSFIRSLLDLTDNAHGVQSSSRRDLVCYDDADPYLVVAPDKGTANYSDLANDIAAEYSFWLDDAFATGGSRGFNHKVLGITARGAWACVERHLIEMRRDIDQQLITVIGVGGMEGDVFGNGMLQSDNIRLLAAFNADYIFFDPAPDRAKSYAERKRLFETPGSTWDDYNRALISRGGGVLRRHAKDIRLSPEIREMLGARDVSFDGEEVVRLVLTAPVDLLWMGGVGVYVKASSESNDAVGDRVNDGARVNASDVKAKVVGEGANLGFTQRARIEYALLGGRINTDAIDNSGGVDLSDHEVNIKILFSPYASGGSHAVDRASRDQLLRDVTEDVCVAVVNNNYRQSLCLSLERLRSAENISPFLDLADMLENAGHLDRDLEAFPSRRDATARDGGLTRPEHAVLIAHAKLALKRALLESHSLLDSEWAHEFLVAYFPERLRTRFPNRIKEHLLGREIAATVICNRIIDQAGATFLVGFHELEASRANEATQLYLAFDQILQGNRWRDALCALDGEIASERQYELLLQLEDALAFLCRWAWEHGQRLTPHHDVIERWRLHLRKYLRYLGESTEFNLLASAAPDASRVLFLSRLRDFPAMVELANVAGKNFEEVPGVFDGCAGALGLRQIAALVSELKPRDIWERRLQTGLDDQFRSVTARLAQTLLRTKADNAASFVAQFDLGARLAQLDGLRHELLASPPAALTPFAAYAAELDSFVDACAAVAVQRR